MCNRVCTRMRCAQPVHTWKRRVQPRVHMEEASAPRYARGRGACSWVCTRRRRAKGRLHMDKACANVCARGRSVRRRVHVCKRRVQPRCVHGAHDPRMRVRGMCVRCGGSRVRVRVCCTRACGLARGTACARVCGVCVSRARQRLTVAMATAKDPGRKWAPNGGARGSPCRTTGPRTLACAHAYAPRACSRQGPAHTRKLPGASCTSVFTRVCSLCARTRVHACAPCVLALPLTRAPLHTCAPSAHVFPLHTHTCTWLLPVCTCLHTHAPSAHTCSPCTQMLAHVFPAHTHARTSLVPLHMCVPCVHTCTCMCSWCTALRPAHAHLHARARSTHT